MIYYGNGGFNFSDLYTMPVYLRNFYFRKMVDTKTKEKEAQEAANKKGESPNSNKKIHRPDINRTPKT